jgi:hypothetical protein
VVADFRHWLDRQEDAATDVGVRKGQFWCMTPAELADRVEIVNRRDARAWERAAWMTHHIMSAFVGSQKAPSIDRLLGRVTDA